MWSAEDEGDWIMNEDEGGMNATGQDEWAAQLNRLDGMLDTSSLGGEPLPSL